MIQLVDILSEVITEGKRFKFEPETYMRMLTLADNLWDLRAKNYTRKTFVEKIPFKTSDGADGMVKVYINPRLKDIASMETKPVESRDPMDFVMELQPKEYGSKKNLFLTIFHEMLHATDPTQSTKFSPKFMMTYDDRDETKYWGHPIEFRAITNEFLEGLVLEFERRIDRANKPSEKLFLERSLDNIMSYFATNQPLTKVSKDILFRINDEQVLDNRISELISNMKSDYPNVVDIIPQKNEDEPYYITYIQLIKKHNPASWPKFLKMLYNTYQEIKDYLNKKGV